MDINDYLRVEESYRKFFDDSNDPLLIRIVYATYLANFFSGNPVWMTILGMSGVGKTEYIKSFDESENQVTVSNISSRALLSFKNEQDSLLNVADRKVLLVRDFSTITQVHADERAQLYAWLRDVYDGGFVRSSGDGFIRWEGKIGLIACSTNVIEQYNDFNQQLGERFLYTRLRVSDTSYDNVLDTILNGASNKHRIASYYRQLAAEYIDNMVADILAGTIPSVTLSKKEKDLLKDAAKTIALCRTQVIRDRYSKSITSPVEACEVPTRVIQSLQKIVLACKVMGFDDSVTASIIVRLAMDGVPYKRMKLIKAIVNGARRQNEIVEAVKMSQSQVSRDLSEIKLLNIVSTDKSGRYRVENDFLREHLGGNKPKEKANRIL